MPVSPWIAIYFLFFFLEVSTDTVELILATPWSAQRPNPP